MAAERELEAAAERRAVQRGDDRLPRLLDRLDDLDQPGRDLREQLLMLLDPASLAVLHDLRRDALPDAAD